MSKFASGTAARMLRTRNGAIGDSPRLSNLDLNADFYGYLEPDTAQDADRIRRCHAFFAADSPVREGDLLQDRADGGLYLTAALNGETMGGEIAYLTAVLYHANAACSIERFDTGAVNAFGRSLDPSPTIIAEEVPVATGSLADFSLAADSGPANVQMQKDQDLPAERTKVAIQSRFEVRINDRLVSGNGDTYKVTGIDSTLHKGLRVLHVDRDIR